MSLTSALSIALSGLQTSTAQLQVISNNISNAQTAGYTAKTANVSSVDVGQYGGGATIAGFTRATDAGLTTAYNAATSSASYYSTQNNYLSQVQTILSSTSSNPALSSDVAAFQSAWTQYQAAPESTAQQQAVIQAGANLAGDLRTAASAVQTLSRQVTSDTFSTVATLNTDLAQVQALNLQIADSGANSASSADLADQRDAVVNKIAAITSVTVVQRNNGQIALYTPQGTSLLDGSAQTFTYNGTKVTSSNGQDVTGSLTGGSLQAEINFAATSSPVSGDPGTNVLQKLTSQLTALATAFTSTTGSPQSFASAYNSGTSGSSDPAYGFFTATIDGNGNADPSSIQINANLLNGTANIPSSSATAVTTALQAVRSFTADGLNTTTGTYADLATDVISNFQQAANTVSSQSTTATTQKNYYQQSLSNETGVNVDNQLVELTQLQNSYAASAHVISTVNQMLTTLNNIL
jgi:flagellar hook-associated protein 1 FlgK